MNVTGAFVYAPGDDLVNQVDNRRLPGHFLGVFISLDLHLNLRWKYGDFIGDRCGDSLLYELLEIHALSIQNFLGFLNL